MGLLSLCLQHIVLGQLETYMTALDSWDLAASTVMKHICADYHLSDTLDPRRVYG